MTKEEIQTKYNTLCAQLGDCFYKMETLKKSQETIYTEIKVLDTEYGKLLAEEQNKAKTEEAQGNGQT